MPQTGINSNDDILVNWLTKKGIPVNRENYLQLAYPDGPPRPWTAEHESALPDELQDMDKVEDDDDSVM